VDFVVFSDDWGRRPSAPQHLFAVLARRHRVLWVEPAGLRRPRVTRADLARSAQKLRGFLPGAPPASADPWLPQPASLTRLVPPVVPAYGVPAVRAVNDRAVSRAVTAAMEDRNFVDPVVLTTIPTVAGAVTSLGPCSIYWRVDDFSLWPGYDADAIREREQALLGCVDLLLASAPALLAPAASAAVFPHGVDAGHWAAPPRATDPVRKVVVAGRLDGRLDAELLSGFADARPDVTLELVGDAVDLPGALLARPNVLHTPYVAYQALPAHLAAADLLLIPYRLTPWTQSLAPLKVREYLATGRPVVTTALRGIIEDPEVRPHVTVVTGVDDLLAACDAPTPPRDFDAASMSWEQRAADLEAQIALLRSPAL